MDLYVCQNSTCGWRGAEAAYHGEPGDWTDPVCPICSTECNVAHLNTDESITYILSLINNIITRIDEINKILKSV